MTARPVPSIRAFHSVFRLVAAVTGTGIEHVLSFSVALTLRLIAYFFYKSIFDFMQGILLLI